MVRVSIGTNRERRLFAVLLCSLGLSGCIAGPSSPEFDDRLSKLRDSGLSEPKVVTVNQEYARTIKQHSIANSSDNTDQVRFKPVSLRSSLSNALNNNIEIERAATQISGADAAHFNSVLGYFPQVSATINYNKNKQEVLSSDNTVFALGKAKYKSQDATVEVNQPLFDLGRIYAIKIASTARTSAEVGYIATVQEVMFKTFDAYISAAQSKSKIRFLGQRQALLRRRIHAQTKRTESGLAQVSSRQAQQIDFDNLGLELVVEEQNLSRQLSELSLLTGKRVSNIKIGNLPRRIFGTERRVTANQAIKNAERQNPRLLRSIIAVAESDLKRQQAISADFSPVLSAFAQRIYENRDNSRFGGGSETRDLIVGVRLNIPIFNAQGNGYQSLTTNINFRDAELQYLKERRQIRTGIIGAIDRMATISKGIKRSRSALRNSRRLIATEQSRVGAGVSQTFLVDAIRSRELIARERMRYYELEYLRAWGRLEYLSGLNLAKSVQ